MAEKLDGRRVAILVANGFEQVEMTDPRLALEEAEEGTVRGTQPKNDRGVRGGPARRASGRLTNPVSRRFPCNAR
jgi:putative intracellular protease/amidase